MSRRRWPARRSGSTATLPHRRPGAFLSRRPGRARRPERGRRHAGLFLDPASERGAAHRRPDARRAGRRGHRRSAGAWAAASAARRARRRNGRRSPRSPRARPGGRARCRLDRDDDMIMTGKRHDFRVDYDVGFDDDGRARAPSMSTLARALRLFGRPVARRQRPRDVPRRQRLFLSGGAHPSRERLQTNTVSNTAFRGFGGPQGMLFAERDDRRHRLRRSASIRSTCASAISTATGRDVTPYGMQVEDNIAPRADRRRWSAPRDYRARRAGDRRVQRRRARS